jgi:hypothetical protein
MMTCLNNIRLLQGNGVILCDEKIAMIQSLINTMMTYINRIDDDMKMLHKQLTPHGKLDVYHLICESPDMI